MSPDARIQESPPPAANPEDDPPTAAYVRSIYLRPASRESPRCSPARASPHSARNTTHSISAAAAGASSPPARPPVPAAHQEEMSAHFRPAAPAPIAYP